MRVMGIDPSTSTGVAVVDSGRVVVHSGVVHYPKLSGWARIQAISFAVLELVRQYKPDQIVIEDMIVGHASSAITVIQVASFIRFLLWQEGYTYHDVHPSTLKKFLTGNGNASKEQIMVHVTAKYAVMPKTNDEADAINCSMFGLALAEPYKGMDKDTKAVVTKWLKSVPTLDWVSPDLCS